VHEGDVSVYVNDVDLISLSQKHNSKEHEGKTIERDGRVFLLGAVKLVGIGRRERIPNYRGIFQLGTA
jgi:hypothetical protein